jgi:hypothetical protein
MGGVAFKVAIGGFLVWLSAQMGTFAEEILGKVRESVQASELVEIDRYVAYESAFGQDPSKKAHAPKDQAEFEQVLREWTTASGNRNVTLDRWDQPYAYFKIPSRDPRDVKYRITSKGADKKIGSADDLVVERENDHSSINRDPTKIAESAIEQKKALDREVARRANELLRQAPGQAAKNAAHEGPKASTAELLEILKKA